MSRVVTLKPLIAGLQMFEKGASYRMKLLQRMQYLYPGLSRYIYIYVYTRLVCILYIYNIIMWIYIDMHAATCYIKKVYCAACASLHLEEELLCNFMFD